MDAQKRLQFQQLEGIIQYASDQLKFATMMFYRIDDKSSKIEYGRIMLELNAIIRQSKFEALKLMF